MLNTIKEKEVTKVQVAVRVRPFVSKEIISKNSRCIKVLKENNQIMMIGSEKSFVFDSVFDVDSKQNDIYEKCIKDLVLGCFEGYNATVLAYGQTGSGKTYTMGSGTNYATEENELGIIPRVIKEIFNEKEKRKENTECLLKVSFLEIYNEDIVDLLDQSRSRKKKDNSINIREEKDGSISLYGLMEQKVDSCEELASILERGSLYRTTSSTLMNETSSRSHAIFTIFLEQHDLSDLYKNNVETSEVPGFRTAKFHFVDLAGSEKIDKTGATGSTLKEGININMGLLCLGNVIAALTEPKIEGKNTHVPYRNSKLTRILQDSLGGNSKTYMIACVSPAESNFAESLNTLKYASRARNIRNKPIVNTDPQSALVSQLKQQIFELNNEILKYKIFFKDKNDLKNQFNEYQIETTNLNNNDNEELKNTKIELARESNRSLILETELIQLRNNLNEKEISYFTILNERDILSLKFNQAIKILDQNQMEFIYEEENIHYDILAQYKSEIEQLSKKLKDKDILNNELKEEIEKIIINSKEDYTLLIEKIKEADLMKNKYEKLKKKILILQVNQNKPFEENDSKQLEEESNILTEVENIIEEDEQTKEMNEDVAVLQTRNKATEMEIELMDSTLKEKEKLMINLSMGLNKTEKNVLIGMKEQYHKKITSLQEEIKSLEKQREETKNNFDNLDKNKILNKINDLETQLKDFKKKEKNQKILLKQVEAQKNKLFILDEEIKKMKNQKLTLLKKLKEDTENFEKYKLSRQKELNEMKKKSQEKDLEIQKLKIENSKKETQIKRKSVFLNRAKLDQNSYIIDEIILNFERKLQNYIDNEINKNKEELEYNEMKNEVDVLRQNYAELIAKTEQFKREQTQNNLYLIQEKENKLNECQSEINLMQSQIENMEENISFKSKKIKKYLPNNKNDLLSVILNEKSIVGSHQMAINVFSSFLNRFIEESYEKSVISEKLILIQSQMKELKKKLEQMIQNNCLAQKQHEFAMSKLINEYEERYLWLQTQNSDLEKEDNFESKKVIIPPLQLNSIPQLESARLDTNYTKRKEKNYDDIMEKNYKLERNCTDLIKKQQNSEKTIQILKRKLEVVQEKYDQLRKSLAKEKFIGINQNNPLHKISTTESSLEDSPKFTPIIHSNSLSIKSANVINIANLKATRDNKKISHDNNEEEEQNWEELENIQSKLRTDSFDKAKIQKQIFPFSIKKNQNTNNKVVLIPGNSHSNFGSNKELKSARNYSVHLADEINVGDFEFGIEENSKDLESSESYKTNNWKCKNSWEAHAASISSIASNADLLYSSSNKCFKVWSLENLKCISEVNAHNSFIKTMIYHPEKNVIITASEKMISVWDNITLKNVMKLKGHKDEIRCMHIANDLLYSGGKGSITSGALFSWDLRYPNFKEEREKNQDIFSLISYNDILYYGSRNHQVSRINLNNLYSLEHLSPFEPPHFDAVTCLTVMKDTLISGSRDKNLKLWALDKSINHNIYTAYAHQDWINSLQKHSNENCNIAYSGAKDGLIKIWNVAENKIRCIGDINAHSQSVNSICNLFNNNENMIVSASSDKMIKIWKGDLSENNF